MVEPLAPCWCCPRRLKFENEVEDDMVDVGERVAMRRVHGCDRVIAGVWRCQRRTRIALADLAPSASLLRGRHVWRTTRRAVDAGVKARRWRAVGRFAKAFRTICRRNPQLPARPARCAAAATAGGRKSNPANTLKSDISIYTH